MNFDPKSKAAKIAAVFAFALLFCVATVRAGGVHGGDGRMADGGCNAHQIHKITPPEVRELLLNGATGDGAVQIVAQRPDSAGRKSVGVVLSGGGAKGVAHISCLRALEEAGIPIDYIAGTSMGAIIGGLYAIGYSTHVLDSLVRTQDWNTLVYDRVSRSNLSFGAKEANERYLVTVDFARGKGVELPSGIISGNNVYNLLYELTFGYHDSLDFRKLPIPFACMAYDMVTGNVITLDHGYLPDAIRASMSIPGAFQTVTLDSMVLVDGGIGNNFPADVVKEMGADILIGFDVGAPLRTKDELTSFAAVFDQITSFTALENNERNRAMVDLYIHPDITGYSAASFSADAIDTLLRRGEEAAAAHWDDIVAMKQKIGIDDSFRPDRIEEIALNPPIPVREIAFEGIESENERVLRKIIGIRENTVVSGDDLRQAVTKLAGTSSLTDVQYRLEGDSTFRVVFSVRERHRNTISAGLRFDTEEAAAILLNVRYAGNRMTNSYFDLTGRLGRNPYGRLSFLYGNETQRKFSASYTFRANDLSLYQHGNKISNVDFNQHTVDLSFSNIRLRNFRVALGLRYDYYDWQSVITNLEVDRNVRSEGLFSYYALMQWETLDSRYYPRRGIDLTISYNLSTSNFVQYKGGAPFGAIQVDYINVFSLSRRVAIIPGLFGRVIIGNEIAFPSNNFMGGPVAGRYMPHQMSFVGLYKFEAFDRSIVGAKFDFRVRLWKKNYLSLKAAYAKQEHSFFDIVGGEDIFGFGLNYSYDSFIGPIDVLIDYSNYDKKLGFYFNLGYYF
ncbi:patatin-like phospholipase family protein [Alistipes sp. OttesenSCG-928-B03]|nr:patatin-like phospholipase family protein [Alistipes sp. OttesenSCG-928-B03]